MKFFATIALLLVIVSVSLGADQEVVRAKESKGHEKESRSALYNGGLSNANHQDKHRGWVYGTNDNYYYNWIVPILEQILQRLEQIQKQLNNNATTTESGNESTTLPSTEPIADDTDNDISTIDNNDETTTQDSSFISTYSESRARLAHGHGKSNKAQKSQSKSSKSHSSNAKSDGKNKNHAKGQSKGKQRSHVQ